MHKPAAMLRALLLLAVALMAPLLANVACAAPSQAKVEHLMELMGTDKMLEQMQLQYAEVMRQGARSTTGSKMTADQKQVVERYIVQMSGLMFGGDNRKRFRTMVAQVYSTQFTEREVDDMTRFYQSESGRSIVAKMPQVMQQSTQIAMSWLQTLRPDMDALVAKMQQELRDCEKACNPAGPAKQPL